jgi:MinD-like ATPase involved in chromosome partitioning or flagellar assembly
VTRAVLTALGHPWESALVAALERSPELAVVRRCPDLPDLLAAASAGRGELAIVSAHLRSLDRTALDHLARHGVAVAGAVALGDEAGELLLRQLGLEVVVRSDAQTHDLEDALAGLWPLPAGRRDGPGSAAPPPEASTVEDDPPSRLEDSIVPVEHSRLIAVWGPAGAPGRSTVAITLASELAALGKRTVLVDCDTYGSSVGQSLGFLDEAPGMAAAARASEHGGLDLISLARVAPCLDSLPTLRVLTGIPRADRWPELRSGAVTHILETARQLAEFIVVDCGFSIEDDEELSYDTAAPRRNAATLAALEAADDLLAIGSADPVGLQRLVRAVQEIRSASLLTPTPRVVVNKVRASAVGARPEQRISEALARFAGMDRLVFLPWDQASLDAAMYAGRSLTESAPQSELRRALHRLARECAGVEAQGTGRRR